MTVTEHFPALPATPEELDQPFHIMFSPESMQRLRRIAFDDSHLDPVAAMLARAQMAASERNFGQARQLVLAAFVADNDRWRTDDGRFAEFLTAALVTYQLNGSPPYWRPVGDLLLKLMFASLRTGQALCDFAGDYFREAMRSLHSMRVSLKTNGRGGRRSTLHGLFTLLLSSCVRFHWNKASSF
jgi:hypothetical protein